MCIRDSGITTASLADYGCTIGAGVTIAVQNAVIPGSGTTSTFSGYLKAIVTGVSTDATGAAGGSTFDVKIVSRVTGAAGTSSYSETKIDYSEGTRFGSIKASDTIFFVNGVGINTGAPNAPITAVSASVVSVSDWYNNQTLDLDNASISVSYTHLTLPTILLV